MPQSDRPGSADLAAREPELAAAIESLLAEQTLMESRRFLADGPARPSDGRAGEVVGDYTLLAPLGEGGMGSVWLARRSDGRFEANVALKFLSPVVLGDTGGARFRREGRLLAQLTHANVAHLIDAGVTRDAQPYLVLEYVDGQPIDAYCNEAGLDVDARVRLFLDVLAAVAEAHRKLIVHRDIKPSNVIVRRDGVVKLIDFGIAKLIGEIDSVAEPLTRDGKQAFTPEYAAPEQIRGDEVTTVTDVYSLGVLLYELLTGERPFSRAEKDTFAVRDTELDPPIASSHLAFRTSFRRRLEGDLDNILTKALRSDARERYASVGAFADDLRRFLANEPVTAHVDTLTYRARKFVRRHRGTVAAGTLTAVALIAATIITTLQSIEAQHQRDAAQHQLQLAQASNDFVTSLLSQDAPDSKGLTPVELIDRGMDAIRHRYADDPGFSISILLLLSGRYMDLGRTDKEYGALLEAESIARNAHDSHALLDVLCNTVETEMAAGRHDRAIERMSEARALLASTRQRRTGNRGELSAAGSGLAREHLGDAIEYLERAKAVLERGGETYGNVYGAIFSWLYSFNHAAGRNLAAHHYHHRRVERMSRSIIASIPCKGRMALISLAHSWQIQGEVRKAVDLFEKTFKDSDVLQINPVVALRYGRALSLLGRHDEALSRIDAGIALTRSNGQVSWLLSGELDRAQALLRAGRRDEAQQALDAVLPRIEAAAATEQIALAYECQAEIDFADGRLDDAEAAANRALSRLGYPHSEFGSWPALALTTRARIRSSAGHPAEAVEDATAAVELLEADVVDARQSATVGAAHLARAEAELAAGDDRSARADGTSAAESLRNGVGADHPSTQEAEQLVERLSGTQT